MRRFKRFTGLIPLLILWLMGSVLLWGWIFTRLTDTVPQRKIVLFVDGEVPRSVELAAVLEESKPEGIKMIQVHPFSYAMLNGDALRSADLYLVRASDAEQYREWFAPLPPAMISGKNLPEDGRSGLKAYDAVTGKGAASEYIAYMPAGAEPEDYYLFFGASSLHVPGMENAVDDAALSVARTLLSMP